MHTKYLKNTGVEICDIDITLLSDAEYSQIRDIYDEELVVLLRHQESENPWYFAQLVDNVCPIRNLRAARWKYENKDIHNPIPHTTPSDIRPRDWIGDKSNFPVQRVTGQKLKGTEVQTGIFGTGTLGWHTDMSSTHMPPGVALQAVTGVENTSTTFLDTTKVYNDMPLELKERCEYLLGYYTYVPEKWAEGLPTDQLNVMHYLQRVKENSLEYIFPLINWNNAKTKKGMYFHFNNECRIPEAPELVDVLKELCLQEKYMYTHWWEPGDIILMNQSIVLHKRDQDEPAVLEKRVLHRYSF